MNFWEIFTNLCEVHCEKATVVLQELGLSKGNVARWKNGGSPKLDTAAKVAEHFGVSLDELVPQAKSGERKEGANDE